MRHGWMYCAATAPLLGMSSLFMTDVAVLRIMCVVLSLFFSVSAAVHAFIEENDYLD